MRLYDEKEIGEILRRTAELSKAVRSENADGLSLEELKKLATDAGLDPALVVQAAAELSAGPATGSEGFDLFGGPLTYSVYHNLDVDVTDEMWEQMLPMIREHFNDPGVVSTRSSVYEWTGSSSSLEAASSHVSLQNKPSGNQLHIIWSENATAIPFYVPTLIGFILSGVFIFEEFAFGLEGIPIWMAITGLLFLLCRLGVVTFKKSRIKKIKALEKRLRQFALQEQHATMRQAIKAAETSPLNVVEQLEEADPVAVPTAKRDGAHETIRIPDDEFSQSSDERNARRERE